MSESARAVDTSNVLPGPGASVAQGAHIEKAATQLRPGTGVEIYGYDHDPDESDVIDLPGSSVGRLHLLRYLDV